MDFGKFDMRGKAEAGQAFPILHPETGTPLIEDGKPAMFIIRGNSAPSVQAAQKAALARAMQSKSEDEATFTFGDLHEKLIDAALPLLAGFENVELNGVPVTMENAREFLNIVFPRVVKNDKGVFETKNKTFPMQVIKYASELDEALGNV